MHEKLLWRRIDFLSCQYIFQQMEYYPPFSSRSTDELIEIAGGTTARWQADAITGAKQELLKRGITNEDQKKRFEFLEQQKELRWQEELASRRMQDYSIIEKVIMLIFWPRTLLHTLIYHRSLQSEGYVLMAKSRKVAVIFGVVLTLVALLIQEMRWQKSEQDRLKEIERVVLPEDSTSLR